jgi:hypothetical protein
VTGEVVGEEVHFDLAVCPSDIADGVDHKEISNVDGEFLYVRGRASINTRVGAGKVYQIGFEAVVADSEYSLGIGRTR